MIVINQGSLLTDVSCRSVRFLCNDLGNSSWPTAMTKWSAVTLTQEHGLLYSCLYFRTAERAWDPGDPPWIFEWTNLKQIWRFECWSHFKGNISHNLHSAHITQYLDYRCLGLNIMFKLTSFLIIEIISHIYKFYIYIPSDSIRWNVKVFPPSSNTLILFLKEN